MAGDQGKMHDAGVAEARERVALNRALDREEIADKAVAEAQLLQEVGLENFTTGKEVLMQYLGSLPAAERARIETGTTKDGVPFLQDPTTLRALTNKALGEWPRTPEAV